MKTKKLNYENGISYYLTSSTESYTTLAKVIESNLHKLGNNADITPRRVKEWAHGTLPKGVELDALCLTKYGDCSKWRDLYFPNIIFTIKFIKYITEKEVNQVLESSNIDLFIENRNLSTLYNGLADKDATLCTLASILVMKIYYKLRNEDILFKLEEVDYSFEKYKSKIILFLDKRLNSIPLNSVFVQSTMKLLKNTLDKSETNRANIRREVLRQIIKVI